jgi:hypothetical protein
MNMSEADRRKFIRIEMKVEIKVEDGETIVTEAKLRDISLGGMFVLVEEPLTVGTACTLTIKLEGWSSLLRIGLQGEVVRVEEGGMAVKFTKIDLDSLVHLRYLIKIHTRDPEIVDEEFSKHLMGME